MDSISTESKREKVIRIGFRNVLAILCVGTAGQIAWAVENSWFNTFVYDRITTSPRPIAWMVAVSAITAMLTTLFMGILSDRTHSKWGKRKPYIVFGYILWGIITAIYPMIEWIQNVGIAVVFVVITDSIMTFFGSTSNDAAYNAWLKDVSQSSNRNRIQSINNITGYLANAIALVAAGFIIDSYGYFVFFYALGGFVTLTGVLSSLLIPSSPSITNSIKKEKSFAKELAELVNPKILTQNRTLFLLFINMALGGIAGQVYFPYLLIFLENYVGFSKSEMSIYLAIYILSVILVFIIFGLISHKTP
jgi:Na+/melibiose symporter-like transporter